MVNPPESGDAHVNVGCVTQLADNHGVQHKTYLTQLLCNKLAQVANIVHDNTVNPQPKLTFYDVWRQVSGTTYETEYVPRHWSAEDQASLHT